MEDLAGSSDKDTVSVGGSEGSAGEDVEEGGISLGPTFFGGLPLHPPGFLPSPGCLLMGLSRLAGFFRFFLSSSFSLSA